MSNENDSIESSESTDSNSQPDPIKNLKAEFNRKLENIQKLTEQTSQESAQALQQISSQISSMNQPKVETVNTDSLEDLRYTDPDLYLEKKEAALEKKIEDKVLGKVEVQTQKTSTINQLLSDYPELKDQASALYKKAVSISSQMNPNVNNTAEGYKLAVREAALELDLLPINKRRSEEIEEEEEMEDNMDEFIGGGGGGSKSSSRNKNKKSKDLDQKVAITAEVFGVNPDDPEVRKRLIENQKRDWKKWK